MKLPKMCQKSTSFDQENAGWYVPNSIIVTDILPEWRLPGGGVCQQELTQDVNCAFTQAISYTKIHIEKSKRHLQRLEAAQSEWISSNA